MNIEKRGFKDKKLYHRLSNDYSTFFDVDETLVFWGHPEHEDDETIEVQDPYYPSKTVKLVKHQRNIEFLIRKSGQGQDIIVWSAGGSAWAETIVKALGLEEYVTLVMSKPSMYVDDLDVSHWGMSRVYLSKHFKPHTPKPITTGEDNGKY